MEMHSIRFRTKSRKVIFDLQTMMNNKFIHDEENTELILHLMNSE
jgi:hypothetical protein